jgi:hypothetical protein
MIGGHSPIASGILIDLLEVLPFPVAFLIKKVALLCFLRIKLHLKLIIGLKEREHDLNSKRFSFY